MKGDSIGDMVVSVCNQNQLGSYPMRRELMPGYFIKFAGDPTYQHHIGGRTEMHGAQCPNCRKPLMLYLSLDTTDARLGLQGIGVDVLRLFACLRCALTWHGFAYTILDENSVKLVEYHVGQTTWDDWYEDVGVDMISHRPIVLESIPARVIELYERLNDEQTLTESEEMEIAQVTNSFADKEAGGYPVVDVVNQVGGTTFLPQLLDAPHCRRCAEQGNDHQTFFLASLTNDAKQGLKIAHDGTQLVFFLCPVCRTVHFVQSI